MTLEDNVRRNLLRLEAIGYKQGELASFAGISRQQINRILNDNGEPRLRTIEQLARSLGLNPKAMIFDEAEFETEIESLSVAST